MVSCVLEFRLLSDEALLAAPVLALALQVTSLARHSLDVISIGSRDALVGAMAANKRNVPVMNLMV